MGNISNVTTQLTNLLVTERSQSLFNLTNFTAGYTANISFFQGQAAADFNQTQNDLAILRAEQIDGEQLLSGLNQSTIALNVDLANLIRVEANWTSSLVNFLGELLDALNSGSSQGSGLFFSGLIGALESGGEAALGFVAAVATHLVDDIANNVGGLATALAKLVEDTLGALNPLNFLGEIGSLVMFIFFFIMICCILGCVGYCVFQNREFFENLKLKRDGKTKPHKEKGDGLYEKFKRRIKKDKKYDKIEEGEVDMDRLE